MKISTDDCWLWAGYFYGGGHGKLYLGNEKAMSAHKAVYESEVGEVPDGLELDHLCENPPCVNPAHLEPVTHHENTKRHYRNKTHCRQGHPYAQFGYIRNFKGNISKSNPTGASRSCRECRRLGSLRDWETRKQRRATPDQTTKGEIE